MPTPNVDYDIHKKDRVWQSKEPGKEKAKESSQEKVNTEEKHLVHLPGTTFEALHLQETPALLLAENGEPQDIVPCTKRPALATTITHHSAEIGPLQEADVN